jgi:two-component system, NarL family, nitrate/nitrite response regulator NarL
LLRKINASNRTQAAIWGFNNGFGEGKAGYLAKA